MVSVIFSQVFYLNITCMTGKKYGNNFGTSRLLPMRTKPFDIWSSFTRKNWLLLLTLLHSERPKLYAILAFLSAVGLRVDFH